MDKFTITEEESGIRLDVYVQEQMTQYSRSTIQKLLKNGTILINGKETRSAYKLKEGDVIDATNVGMGVVEASSTVSTVPVSKIALSGPSCIRLYSLLAVGSSIGTSLI